MLVIEQKKTNFKKKIKIVNNIKYLAAGRHVLVGLRAFCYIQSK